jgi:Dolichyl-phosphate-mannose-protein mannosyltransferase
LTTKGANQDSKYFVDWQRETSHGALIGFALVFLFSCLILFLGMSRRPIVYDEGLILTAAMRVAAGQIPHRDFYANYGPAQFYLLAGLFKLFGESLLVERLLDLFLKALVVTSVYCIASSYCRRSIAVCTSIITVLLLFGLNGSGSTIIPVSLLNLIGSALILPVFLRGVSTRRMFAAGAVAGVATLFRYDTGVALVGIHACVITIAIYRKGGSNRLRTFASTFWPYLLGFAVLTLPPALYYLSVAPLHSFVHDIILYPAKYYRRGRDLPFPGIYLKGLENLEIYLPIAVIGVSLYVAVARYLEARGKGTFSSQRISEELDWQGFLITFGLLALVMYCKGFVRVSVAEMYLSIVPSFLLIAVLFQHRLTFPRLVRISIMCFVWLSVVAMTWASLHVVKLLYVQHLSVAERMLSVSRGTSPESQTTWCKIANPLTEGFCFLPEDDRIQTIEFIDSHTRPDQQLYVGSTKHDRIFINDNLTYFATQRLPATKWSHFDPGLQNSYDIQTQMVHELDVNAPPYIVLDSEFDLVREPNDSSKSTGVTLLDDYIQNKYQHIKTFGKISVWQRIH